MLTIIWFKHFYSDVSTTLHSTQKHTRFDTTHKMMVDRKERKPHKAAQKMKPKHFIIHFHLMKCIWLKCMCAIILSVCVYILWFLVWNFILNLPRQLALIGHVVVAFCIKYALSVVKDGLLRKVSSSFFQTYVICDNSYDTVEYPGHMMMNRDRLWMRSDCIC